MKRFLSLVLALLLLFSCAACSSDSTEKQTPTQKETPEHEAAVTAFLDAYFRGDSQAVASCVPSDLYPHFKKMVDDTHLYGHMVAVESTLKPGNKLPEQSVRALEDRYQTALGISLSIEEAHVYHWNASVIGKNGKEFLYQSGEWFILNAIKIDGAWYAITEFPEGKR